MFSVLVAGQSMVPEVSWKTSVGTVWMPGTLSQMMSPRVRARRFSN